MRSKRRRKVVAVSQRENAASSKETPGVRGGSGRGSSRVAVESIYRTFCGIAYSEPNGTQN
jgi:hypothetical protein